MMSFAASKIFTLIIIIFLLIHVFKDLTLSLQLDHHYINLQITVLCYTAHQIFSFSNLGFFVPREMHVLKNIREHVLFFLCIITLSVCSLIVDNTLSSMSVPQAPLG